MTKVRNIPGSAAPFMRLLACSLLLHAAVAALCSINGLLRSENIRQTMYQVDLVDSAPSSTQQRAAPQLPEQSAAQQLNPYPPSVRTAPPSFATPVRETAPVRNARKSDPDVDSGDPAQEFTNRLVNINRKVDDRAFASALDGLKQRKKPIRQGDGRSSGGPYYALLESLLRKAFIETIAYQSGTPTTVVRIAIDPGGRLIHLQVEKGSGDKLFDDSALQAVHRAKSSFPAPPDGKLFDQLFVFLPETGTSGQK
jgi:TonB family protein